MGSRRWLTTGAVLTAAIGLAACGGQEDTDQEVAGGESPEPVSTEAQESDCPSPMETNGTSEGDPTVEETALEQVDAEDQGWSAQAWHCPEEECVSLIVWTAGGPVSEVPVKEYHDRIAEGTDVSLVSVYASDGHPPEEADG
ncbi:hypothetical protein [Nesterenkonia sp.]|uniref:hypothetical protein n=1 Tax=Nesterenkonia sp. TaxID=704201 RepID=UPI00261B929D|nr:hypothetical protein [Nesterenkonia sp.]